MNSFQKQIQKNIVGTGDKWQRSPMMYLDVPESGQTLCVPHLLSLPSLPYVFSPTLLTPFLLSFPCVRCSLPCRVRRGFLWYGWPGVYPLENFLNILEWNLKYFYDCEHHWSQLFENTFTVDTPSKFIKWWARNTVFFFFLSIRGFNGPVAPAGSTADGLVDNTRRSTCWSITKCAVIGNFHESFMICFI